MRGSPTGGLTGRVVLVTAPSTAAAEGLVRTLVEEDVVACGNILPGVTSIFRWKGEIERESEVLIILKTTEARVSHLLERVPELHPYDVPEVLVLPVDAGHPPYLAWLAESSPAARGEQASDDGE